MLHMTAEAQAVIAMRTMGMAGIWSVTGTENERMVAEKADALRASWEAQTAAAWKGAGPLTIAEAGLKPYRQRTRANARRLAKRGLKGI